MSELQVLLEEWGVIEILPLLEEHKISYERLKFLTEDDIKELTPVIGLRAEFRERLFLWKKQKFDIDDLRFATNKESNAESPSVGSSIVKYAHLDVKNILSSCEKGKATLSFYKCNSFLLESHRRDIISTLLDHIFLQEICLNSSDFKLISEQISAAFPNENKEYYYIPRMNRKAASGKLYDKYHNIKSKRRKIDGPNKENVEVSDGEPEIDEKYLQSLKESLKIDIAKSVSHGVSPPIASEAWVKTYALRKKELKLSKNNEDFMNQWPAFKQSFGFVLIQSDFKILHPGKHNCFFEKWPQFKSGILDYYNFNVKDQKSKEELTCCKQIQNSDSKDFIIFRLLNSVILPTARFKNEEGKSCKKFTITEGQESFTVLLTSLNNYRIQIKELADKYYSCSLNIQPMVIVVGTDIYNISEFYVYFDGYLYKLNSYIECINICFQLFHVLHLNYPKASQGVWLFLQKYFYSITTSYDFPAPSVTALLNFFKNKNSI